MKGWESEQILGLDKSIFLFNKIHKGREGRNLNSRDAATPEVQAGELLPEPSSAAVISSCLAPRAVSPAEGWVQATTVDLRSFHTILSAKWERSVSGFGGEVSYGPVHFQVEGVCAKQ